MTADNSACFDITVFGQVTEDIIECGGQTLERWGGGFYAASAAAHLKNRVQLLAICGTDQADGASAELSSRGISPKLLPIGAGRIAYHIENGNEILPQAANRSGPVIEARFGPFNQIEKSRSTLAYPLSADWLQSNFGALRGATELLALDLQHDLDSIDELTDLLPDCDVLFVNHNSIKQLTKEDDLLKGAQAVRARSPKAMIVIKMGMRGSLVLTEDGKQLLTPAFASNFVCTVGAGDAYDAAFLSSLLGRADPSEAARTAALAAACVIESTSKNPAELIDKNAPRPGFAIDPRQPQPEVYVAGHFHSQAMTAYLEQICLALENAGFRCYLPHRDGGIIGFGGVTPTSAFRADVSALHRCVGIVGVIDAAHRGGTYFELGYAHAIQKPIIVLKTDQTQGASNMIAQACVGMVSDVAEMLTVVFERCAPL